MIEDHDHDHEHHGHDHEHNGHDHDHEPDHDHALIVDRLPEGAWQVDPHGSEVLFKARTMFRLLPVTAAFEGFTGALTADAEGRVSGRLVVRTATINSGIDRRDAELRGASFFDSATYPEMTFALEKLEPSRFEHMNLSGRLQIRQTTIPLRFPVSVIAHGDHLHIEGRVIIDHAEAGLGWTRPVLVGKRVRAEAALTLVRA